LVAIIPVYYVTFAKQPDWTANIPAEGKTTHHVKWAPVS